MGHGGHHPTLICIPNNEANHSRTGSPEGTEKVPIFKDKNGKMLRFITSFSINRINKAVFDRKRRIKLRFICH